MANTVIALKKSATPSAAPSNLANGELAINYADGKLYYKHANGSIVAFNTSGGVSFGTVNANGTLVVADAASGIHARHSDYYIRTVRCDIKDPLTKLMMDAGIPNEPELYHPDDIVVFSFPMKSPKGAVTRNDMTALEQLEMWKTYALNWTEHKPSVTISVRDDEWMKVGSWVYDNFDICSGISFLPHSDHTYAQAPYQECSKEVYEELLKKMPKSVDWSKISAYEDRDNTASSQTFACSGEVCEVVDLTK